LLVDDDETFLRTIAAELAARATVVTARTIESALAAVAPSGRWNGALIDYALPDGDAFPLVRALRVSDPDVELVVITSTPERGVPNRAFLERVRFLAKPFEVDVLRVFVDDMIPGGVGHAAEGNEPSRYQAGASQAAVRWLAEVWRMRYALTEVQTEVLLAGFRGESRLDYARRRDVTENTLKTQTRQLLRKTGDESLRDAVERGLRELIPHRRTSDSAT
jgi:DNA-binding NarL/FixJ family response regulator